MSARGREFIRGKGCPRPWPSGKEQRGAVLVIVLCISLGLVSMALYFGQSMMLEYRAADNAVAGLEADHAIEGAQRYVAYVLKNAEEPGRLPDIETYKPEEMPVGDATFWLIGRGDEELSGEMPVFGLVDEASKLNLNVATREMLETLPTMTPELAGAIIDWRDSDSEITDNGAESQNYLLRDPKFNAKDAAFETVEELRLLMGADWEVLFGEDTNFNGVLDPNENDGSDSPPEDDRDGRLDPGVLEYLTVWSREPNTGADGSARVNIRSNDTQQLQQVLQESLDEQRATEIVNAVGSDLANVNSLLEFYIRSRMTAEEFALVDDALTVTDGATTGLVNVNTASAAVLACLPGIGQEYADQLVSWRQGQTDALNSVAWVTNVMEEEAAIQAGPYLTTNSYQFSADIAAVGRGGRGFRRVLFIIDTSGDAPAIIYRRDRTRCGWPLGAEVRERLSTLTAEQGRIR